MAQTRDVRITLRDRQTTGGSIPSDALFGEPFVNAYDGILRFSGVTGGSFEPSTQSGVFEVGSTLYNQKITNRLNINNNFIISGGTGIISTYQGSSSLAGKFLSGTSSGLVLADIADIATSIDSYTTGATWSPNTLTINLNNGKPSVNVVIDSFNNLTATTLYSGSTNVGSLFVNTISNGTNTTVGGSANHRTVNLVDSPSVNNITYSGTSTGGNSIATNVSATTAFYSAGTNLGTIIYSQITAATSSLTSTRVQPGVNTYTGGTADNPTVNVVASPSFDNVTYSGTSTGGNSIATNVSATTGFYSAGTSLETIIYNIANSTENITSIQPGSNITTGGTANSPIVSVVASPSFNNISFSGTATGGAANVTSLSATSLTNTRVLFAGANGLITDDAGMTYNSGTDVLTVNGNFTTNGTQYSGGSIVDDGIFTIDATTRVEIDSNLLPTTHLTYDLGAVGQRWNYVYAREFRAGISSTVYGDGYITGDTGSFLLDSGTVSVNGNVNPSANTSYNLGTSGLRWNNTYTKDLDVSGAINTTGITISGLLAGSVVYAGSGGQLKTEAGFTYDENTDTFNTKYITVGTPGQTGTTAVIHGDVLVIGESISGFTSQLYIEDNNIWLNYNPTGDTSSTSLGAGWSIQDGDGVANGDVFFDIRGTATGVANRSFATNLNDIRIRETGTVSSPNGVRVLAEQDILDGGSY